jgi:hypothetical protein
MQRPCSGQNQTTRSHILQTRNSNIFREKGKSHMVLFHLWAWENLNRIVHLKAISSHWKPKTLDDVQEVVANYDASSRIFCNWNYWSFVWFEVLTEMVVKSLLFWDITPCSRCKSTDISEEHIVSIFKVLLTACLMPVSCLAYSSTMKMEVTCSTGTSVDFQRFTRLITQRKGPCLVEALQPFFMQMKLTARLLVLTVGV